MNRSNLTVIVPEDHTTPTNKLLISLTIIQSIKNKELAMDDLESPNSDLTIITRIWFKYSEEDDAWVSCSAFNKKWLEHSNCK